MGCEDTSRHGTDAGSRDGANNNASGPRITTSNLGLDESAYVPPAIERPAEVPDCAGWVMGCDGGYSDYDT